MTRPAVKAHVLGSLEARVMAVLWRGETLIVRDVVRALGDDLAHTTVMTTLDRLFKKGLLTRAKLGTAFAYQAALSRTEFERHQVEHAVAGLVRRAGEPGLSAFVDAVADLDEANLARLERLIAARRKGSA